MNGDHPTTLLLLVAALAVGWSGCASSSGADRSSESSDQTKQKRTPSAPTPETLEDSPCGNPNWAELPEQHEVDGDPETSSEAGEGADDAEEAPEEDDEAASDEEK